MIRACLCLVGAMPLLAQGITTAAVQGRVLRNDGGPIPGATVELTHTTNGAHWRTVTRADGQFRFESIAVGPYRVDVRALGFAPQTRSDVVLTLGQRVVLDFTLRGAAVDLTPVTISARNAPVLDRARTGPAEVISRETIERLPNLGRTFFNVTLLSPQVALSPQTAAVPTSGIAIGGQNRVYNSFQIDGGVQHDLYRGQQPGRQSLPRPISLEAIEEIQVLAAPYDVRHGGFTGGLVNAVTRSGGNEVHGSLFGYLADAVIARQGGIGGRVEDFTSWQFGGTVGGPIVRDRAHFFVSVDLQERGVPDPGPLITDTVGGADTARIGISYASAVRFVNILDTLYGMDAGSFGPVAARAPAQDLFAKLTLQAATNSRLEWSFHHARGDRQDFLVRSFGVYTLSSFAQQEPTAISASRLNWSTLFGDRWSNEMIASYLRLTDECRPRGRYPEVRVQVNNLPRFLQAGTAGNCSGAALRQDVLELRNEATLGFSDHAISVGVHGEVLRFRDDLLQNEQGLWVFRNVDSLERRRAVQYQRTFPGPGWKGAIDFGALQFAAYVQDRWSPTRKLTLTAGVRVDVPVLDDPVTTNGALQDSLGIDTGRLPTGNVLWSPRLAVNYDFTGAGHTFVRGGIGFFSGRPPYRWISNAYRDDGTQELFLECRGDQVPAFDPIDQPSGCVSRGPQPRMSAIDANTRSPQNLKVSVGADHRVREGLVATVDLMYTRATRQLYLTDANLRTPTDVSTGEADRPLYGTINAATGVATPTLRSTAFDRVIVVSNRSGDNALSFTAQLRTQGGGRRRVEGSALYSHTRSRDRMWLAHFPARALLEGTVLDGTLENRRLATSWFDVPHRVQVVATTRLPYRASLTLMYAGSTGRPFTYTVSGDPNADGMGVGLRQDPAYVPRDSADITLTNPADWGRLNAFIDQVPCLREQRGRLVARNSCRNPWFGTLNARLTKQLPMRRGQWLEVSADIYNVLNLVNARWGHSRYHGLTFATDLVSLQGYDAAAGRGRYQALSPPRNQINNLASRWQSEISARYVF